MAKFHSPFVTTPNTIHLQSQRGPSLSNQASELLEKNGSLLKMHGSKPGCWARRNTVRWNLVDALGWQFPGDAAGRRMGQRLARSPGGRGRRIVAGGAISPRHLSVDTNTGAQHGSWITPSQRESGMVETFLSGGERGSASGVPKKLIPVQKNPKTHCKKSNKPLTDAALDAAFHLFATSVQIHIR